MDTRNHLPFSTVTPGAQASLGARAELKAADPPPLPAPARRATRRP